jgi:hypothetical protein
VAVLWRAEQNLYPEKKKNASERGNLIAATSDITAT